MNPINYLHNVNLSYVYNISLINKQEMLMMKWFFEENIYSSS